MRFNFQSLTVPKKAAKQIAARTGAALSQVHNAIAKASGYRDWHELEALAGTASTSVPDQHVSSAEYCERSVARILDFRRVLGRDIGCVQEAVLSSRLYGSRQPTLDEQLAIRAKLYRQTDIPNLGPRRTGAIGKIKSRGYDNEFCILKRFPVRTEVIMNNGPCYIADFEYVSPRAVQDLFIPQRLYLPYGEWTEEDGSIVLFSRDYKPLWRARANRKAELVDPWVWIKSKDQKWFANDASWLSDRFVGLVRQRLSELQISSLPRLVDTLPLLVCFDDCATIDDAVRLLKEQNESSKAA